MSDQSSPGQYDAWVGREEERSGQISPSVMQAMAAALDLDTAPAAGDALPPGWQWLFFNPTARRSELGVDGHPAKGGFLPPVALPRRMWAGSRIQYLADVPVGAEASKRSKILKVESKVGKAGALCFVTVEHSIYCGDILCISEQQDIVYKEATPASSAPAPTPKRHEVAAQWSRDFTADTPLLFRYSALTFNGHRIHYDKPYACKEEGYPDLVVHGPLTATLLQQFAVEQSGGRKLASFSFRGVLPLFVNRTFQLEAKQEEDGTLAVWARGPQGELAMSGAASFR